MAIAGTKSGAKLPQRRGPSWAARAVALPGASAADLRASPFAPQLAVLVHTPPSGNQWLHELKWDGYRFGITIVDGFAHIWSRNGIPWTTKLARVAESLERLGLQSAALDGELIAGLGRQADFGTLQKLLSGKSREPMTLVLFDLLHVDGVSIEAAPLLERKELLGDILATPTPGLAFSPHVLGDGSAAYALAAEREFEGIISKRADLPYVHGRDRSWQKTKVLQTDEFAVVGYTPPEGSRSRFGSLLLARADGQGGWTYAGRVGTGFTDKQISELMKDLSDASSQPTVAAPPGRGSLRAAKWFEPRFVVEVYTRGISESGILRQPSLKSLRPDKRVEELLSSDRQRQGG